MKNVTIAVRKKQMKWTGAIVVDGQFQDAFDNEPALGDIISDHLTPLLDTIDQGRVTISVTVDE